MKKKLISLAICALVLASLMPAAFAINVVPVSQGTIGQIYTSADMECYVGDPALVTAAAMGDGAYYQYQWYVSYTGLGNDGTPVPGANSADYAPDTSRPGTYYYYCAVYDAFGGSGLSQPIRITVHDLAVESISIASMPYKTTFNEGDYLDAAGLTIIARMSNGSERVVNAGYQLSPTQFVQIGPQNVTVIYGGRSCTFPVIVQSLEQSITGIGMVSLPMKTQYNVGDYLDTTGLVFRVYTTDGYKDMNTDFVCEPMMLSNPGSQTITLIYKNRTCSFNVTVSGGAKLLEVTSTPRKLSYNVGESLDTAGLVLKMSDGVNSQIISSGFSCEPTVFTSEGTQVVKVRYNDLLATFTVKVSPVNTAAGTVTAKPVVTAKPAVTAAPVTENAEPSPAPSATPRPNRIEHDAYETRSNRSTLVVVMIICIIALIILGALMVLMNTGGLERLKAMFKKSSPRRQDRYRDGYYEPSPWEDDRRDYERRRRDEDRYWRDQE